MWDKIIAAIAAAAKGITEAGTQFASQRNRENTIRIVETKKSRGTNYILTQLPLILIVIVFMILMFNSDKKK
ncbi:MAG: hypothetical protein LBU51_08365 [Bacteroidales bacterium]|jgi:hypothetical protein|nr:hypothetical protein [Bacteroidales bacterium]